MPVRKSRLAAIAAIILIMLMVEGAVLLERPGHSSATPETVIGLVLTDCEDDWRSEMYDSILRSARKHHIQVTTIQTARTLADQIDAIRTLLVYRTDAIIFSPVMENGWEHILVEAAEAEIPLITINERLSQSGTTALQDDAYQVYHIGFDYDTLADQLARTLSSSGESCRLVQLTGTVASSVSHSISDGFRSALPEDGSYTICFSVGCDYMRARADDMIDSLLRNAYDFNAVLCYNDGMALGVIDALTRNGLQPGQDVRIFSIGGGPSAQQALTDGQINAIGQCDLTTFGETVTQTVLTLQSGGTPPESTELPGTLLVNGGIPA